MLASPVVTVLVRRNPFNIHLPMLIGVFAPANRLPFVNPTA